MTLLDLERYRPTDAARMVGLQPSTARRWLQRAGADPAGGHAVSFLSLVELVMVKEIRRQTGLSMQRVRRHIEEAERILKTTHPLARRRFLVDGKHLFVGLSSSGDAPFMELGTEGQIALEGVLRQRARVLDFLEAGDDDFACRWYPLGRDVDVVVDPAVGWGTPLVAGTRIYTRTLVQAVRAEGDDVQRVAELYEIPVSKVEAAMRYEGLQAA